MNTRQYTYLLTISAYGCLSHAAEKLGISQAALSKFLSEQENLLGVELFLRHKKRLYPTPIGKIYIDAASKIISTKNVTLQTINRLNSLPAATIKIASAPYRGAEFFSSVFSCFSSLFPTVELSLLEIYSGKHAQAVHNGTVDFAFGVNNSKEFDDVYYLPLSKEELILAVPSFHALAKYASKDTDQLVSMPISAFKDTPFVLPGKDNNIRKVADELFKKAGFSPLIAFESSNGITVDAMIHKGVGVGIVSNRHVTNDPGVVYFRLDPAFYETTYIKYKQNRILNSVEQCLLGLIIDERSMAKGHILIPGEETNEYLNRLLRRQQTGGFDEDN